MEKLTVIFTKRKWNPASWLIRWCMPRSRFHLSLSSHCLIEDGDYLIEATMLHGVRRTTRDVALKGQTVVATVDYKVPDAQAGLAFAREQVGMSYDFKGAFGIAVAPDRDWTKEGWWFCYELAAAAIMAAGRPLFRSAGHITEGALLLVKP